MATCAAQRGSAEPMASPPSTADGTDRQRRTPQNCEACITDSWPAVWVAIDGWSVDVADVRGTRRGWAAGLGRSGGAGGVGRAGGHAQCSSCSTSRLPVCQSRRRSLDPWPIRMLYQQGRSRGSGASAHSSSTIDLRRM